MKNHNQVNKGNGDNQLTVKELKTIGSFKTEKAPRPLPSACVGWPQQG